MSAAPAYVDSSVALDGLRHLTYKSAAIGRRQDLLLVVPDTAPADVAVVVLLHGVQSSFWSWALLGGAHETLRRLVGDGTIPPMALVLPSDGLWGDGSGYLRHDNGEDYEELVLEAPAVAALVDPRITGRSPLFVCGFSMGGYGALRIAAKHPARFRAVSAHCPITTLSGLQQYVSEDLSRAVKAAPEHDVLHLLEQNARVLPSIRFDCGTEDDLIVANRVLHRELERLEVDHVYEEFAGGHDWPYWSEHLADSLAFFAGGLA